MDYLNYFTATTFGWILAAVIIAVGLFAVMRLFGELRGGQKSYSTRHQAMDERIRKTVAETDELNKTIHKNEQLHILYRALDEVISVSNKKQATVLEEENSIHLQVENLTYHIFFKEKKQFLQSVHKTVYGQGHFEVFEGEKAESEPLIFYDLQKLALYLIPKIQKQEVYFGHPALHQKKGLF